MLPGLVLCKIFNYLLHEANSEPKVKFIPLPTGREMDPGLFHECARKEEEEIPAANVHGRILSGTIQCPMQGLEPMIRNSLTVEELPVVDTDLVCCSRNDTHSA